MDFLQTTHKDMNFKQRFNNDLFTRAQNHRRYSTAYDAKCIEKVNQMMKKRDENEEDEDDDGPYNDYLHELNLGVSRPVYKQD